ncbi:hypothetical protein [Actinacidiphila acididurans]|uniref:Uncharacterized protein n=1 Tax=Actinacidiphila acididurans TaxID=2784346 RepID=A0ABS2TP20_9ACTN|nr:hypothetical protein [Actinacidiphila acididurans]MBM9505086.1 hypothetical protein [Actinacidiphila acididurans]
MSTVPESGRTEDGRPASESSDGPSAAPGDGSATPPPRAKAAALIFDDPLDRPSADDSDRGWGDSPSGAADDDFVRFLNEKPPHHL